MAIRGIDVASYQSDHPDLDGMDFCFVKATEGTGYVNPRMRAQADHARRNGRIVGFYHFVRPGSMRAQAQYFVRECASQPGDPLWLDWEDPEVSCADKDDFLREVVRLRGDTHRVGLYCNTNFWLHHDTTSYCADALWIAVYNGRPGRPGIRHKWHFHQYTSDPIDTNLSTFESRAALRSWCEESRHEPAKPPEKELTMAFDLDTNLSVNDWMKKRWPNDKALQNGIWVQTALASGYGHARRAGDASEQALAELKKLRAERAADRAILDKLVEAVGQAGDFDVADLKREIRAAAAEAVESIEATVTIDVPDDAA